MYYPLQLPLHLGDALLAFQAHCALGTHVHFAHVLGYSPLLHWWYSEAPAL